MPEAVFKQLLSHKDMFLGSSFSLVERSVQVRMKKGILLDCTPDSLESLVEVTELILKTFPHGISRVYYCPTKALETIVSLNPQGLTRYAG